MKKLSHGIGRTGIVIILLVISGLGYLIWYSHINSPDYIAQKRIDDAVELIDQNKPGSAATLLRKVISVRNNHHLQALEIFRNITKSAFESDTDIDQLALIFETLEQELMRTKSGKTTEEWFKFGFEKLPTVAETNPKPAYAIFQRIQNWASVSVDTKPIQVQILRSHILKYPNIIEPVHDLALIYEQDRNAASAKELLMPYREKLGDSESARILGQILISEGDFDTAYSLLMPYSQERLAEFRKAENHYNELVQKIWDKTYEELQAGRAGSDFYWKYNQASENDQIKMVNDYISEKIKQSPDVSAAIEKYRSTATIVPVALDLGILMIHRARNMPDEQSKQAELTRAESTFLAIQGVLGDTDEYRMHLGKVYYWLGKDTQGRQLFEELLESHGRSHLILMNIARLTRELGATKDAIELAEEAYNNADNISEKYMAAEFRAVMHTSLEENEYWLVRSDTKSLSVKASLYSTQAQLATRKGEFNEAESLFKKAIKIHESFTESATNYNNTAVLYLSLYAINSDQKSLRKGIELYDKAIELDPTNSIIISNTSETILQSILSDVCDKRFNLGALKETPSYEVLRYFYKNEKEHKAIAEKIRQHYATPKLLAYLEKGLLLSPKNARLYAHYFEFNRFIRDYQRAEQITQRAKAAAVDVEIGSQYIRDFYAGKKDDELIEAYTAQENLYQAVASEMQRTRNSSTWAMANAKWVESQLHKLQIDNKVELNSIVKTATNVQKKLPSSQTSHLLQASLSARLCHTLARENPQFADLYEKSRRSMGETYTLAFALDQIPQLRNIVNKKSDFKNLVSLIRQSLNDFPSTPSLLDWAILRHADKYNTSQLEATIRKNPLIKLDVEFNNTLYPENSSITAMQYFQLQFDGKNSEAVKYWNDRKAGGAVIPELVKS